MEEAMKDWIIQAELYKLAALFDRLGLHDKSAEIISKTRRSQSQQGTEADNSGQQQASNSYRTWQRDK
jgi:hypothetical protein